MEGDDDSTTYEPRFRKERYSIFLLVTIALLSVALIISATANLKIARCAPEPLPIEPERITCGITLEDALERGCTWDSLAKSWLPKECPRIGEPEYLELGDHVDERNSWIFYGDRDGKTRVEDISMMVSQNNSDFVTGESHWWATEGEHLTHCVYMLQRMAYDVYSGSRFDRLSQNYDHAVHCTEYLLAKARSSPTWDMITTQGNSVFGFCWAALHFMLLA